MLKDALYGVRFGAVVWLQLLFTLFLVYAFRGGFIGWMIGGASLVVINLFLSPLKHISPDSAVSAVTHKFVFVFTGILAFLGAACLSLFALAEILRTTKPVAWSVPGFMCGLVLGLVFMFAYLFLEKIGRKS